MWYVNNISKKKTGKKQKSKNKISLLPDIAEATNLWPLVLGSTSKGSIPTSISMKQVAETPEVVA